MSWYEYICQTCGERFEKLRESLAQRSASVRNRHQRQTLLLFAPVRLQV
jgi:hypothetical protein